MTKMVSETARKLVLAYEEAEQAKDYEYQTCPDQTEQDYCVNCARVCREESQARRAMEANPEAVEYYHSDESRARRRASFSWHFGEFSDPYDY